MDMMALKRMVMGQMASGAEFAKGTFTTDNNSPYTLNFGKTFSKYLYFIEMTDESKAALKSSGINAYRAYSFAGVYPSPNIDGNTPANKNYVSTRYNPSTEAVDSSTNNASSIDESSITITNYDITGASTNALFKGYSYNYFIVEIK